MIPLPELGVEFILGLGVALFAGNLWALLRPQVVKRRTGKKVPSPPAKGRVVLNVVVGLVIAAWAAATLLVRS
ncbi:MAG TPA: hypothetical protein VEN82_04530 [Actinomycetota bacterium]|nr:hypothetical protein [Actinomycetota bacterium]